MGDGEGCLRREVVEEAGVARTEAPLETAHAQRAHDVSPRDHGPYGSLGPGPRLVDQPGAANIIKPLGLAFPLALALVATALLRTGRRWQGILVAVATVVWPVAHVANLPALAVPANVLLVVALGSVAWSARDEPAAATDQDVVAT